MPNRREFLKGSGALFATQLLGAPAAGDGSPGLLYVVCPDRLLTPCLLSMDPPARVCVYGCSHLSTSALARRCP